jgi:hypothetical protein
MKNRIREACFSFLALFLMACGISAAVCIGMLLMPFAFIAVFVLAIREIIIWKRNKHLSVKKRKATKEVTISQPGKGIVRYMSIHNKNERVA